MSASKPTRRWTKWVIRIVLGVVIAMVAVIVVGAFLLASGLPQRRIMESALSDALNARIELGSLSTLHGVKISDLKAFDEAAPDAPPILDVSGFDLDYTLRPADARYFPSLRIDKLAVRLDKSAKPSPAPAAQAKEAKKEKPREKKKKKGKRDSLPFIPKTIAVKDLDFDGALPAAGLAVKGVQVQAKVDSGKEYSGALTGQGLAGSWWIGSRSSEHPFNDGSIDVQVKNGKDGVAIGPLQIHVPGLLEVSGGGEFKEGKNSEIDLRLDKCLAQDVDLSMADRRTMPVPFRFKKLDLSGTRLKATARLKEFTMTMPDTRLEFVAEDLAIGPKGNEFYEGNLALHGAGGPSENILLNVETTLNRNQKIAAKLEGTLMKLAAQASLSDWSLDDVLAVLPKSAGAELRSIPGFQGIKSATLQLNTQAVGVEVKGALKPKLIGPDGAEQPVEFFVESKGMALILLSGSGDFNTTVRAQIGDGSVAANGVVSVNVNRPDRRNQAKITFDKLSPKRTVKALAGLGVLDALGTRVSGTVDVDASADMQDIKLALDLTASPFQYSGVGLPEGQALTLTGNLTANRSPYWNFAGPALELKLGDKGVLSIREYSVDSESWGVKADVTGELDLGMLAAVAPVGDLKGRAKLHLPLQHDRGFTKSSFDGAIEGLGYGGLMIPATLPVTLKGALDHDNLNGRGEVQNLEVTMGPGTSATYPSIKISQSPLRMETQYSVKTDFQALVAMGVLSSATGSYTASAVLKYEDGRLSKQGEMKCDAESLVLTRPGIALGGTHLEAAAQWSSDAGMTGAGLLHVAKATLGVAALQDLDGPIKVDADAIKAENLTGKLFDGAVAAQVEFGILRAGLPLQVKAHGTGLNLETLSRELGVSAFKAAGPADGDLTLALDRAGLKDLQVALQSAGPISVSVEFLSQLLASAYVQQSANKQQIERVMAKILGKEEMHAFDSGKLTLALQGDRLVGQVELKSGKLDFTIDLAIDKAAVLQALQLVQGQSTVSVQS